MATMFTLRRLCRNSTTVFKLPNQREIQIFKNQRLLSSASNTLNVTPLNDPLPPSLTEKYQLDKPSRYVPLTVASFAIASWSGIYHFDAETQLLAVWVLFCGTVYSRGGPIISSLLQESVDKLKEETLEAEEQHIEACKVCIEAAERTASLHAEFQALGDASLKLHRELTDCLKNIYRQNARDEVVHYLDVLVNYQNDVKKRQHEKVVREAAEVAKKKFTSGEASNALRVASFENALASLSKSSSAKPDLTVLNLFQDHIKTWYAAQKARSGTLIHRTPEEQQAKKEAMVAWARQNGLPTEPFENVQSSYVAL